MNPYPHFTDFYALDEDLSEEQRTIVAQVRRFVDSEVLPHIAEWQEAAIFPRELLASFAKLGLLDLVLEDDLDPLTYGVILRELERGSSGLRSVVSVQGSLVLYPLLAYGSEEQQAQWAEPLARFEKIGCFGLTEPDFGSNPAGMLTTAEKIDGGYRINGAKAWITNGTFADVAIIWAKLDGKVNGFLVETNRKGFEARAMTGKWSFRVSDTAQLFLDNVEIPEANRLPGATSLGKAIGALNQARSGIAFGVCGAAGACLEETVAYLKERKQFNDQPLASHQLIQGKLAWMAAELTAMQCVAWRLMQLKGADKMHPVQVSLAKMNNCRKALEIARTCRELLGANGIHNEYHIGRRMMDLETVVTYEGTEHIHALILGQHITGIAAYG
jgi:glutaryl-CoA dehydrogenase